MKKDDIYTKLVALDEEVFLKFDNDFKFTCILVGSSVLMLEDLIPRGTLDIDVISASSEIANIMRDYCLNKASTAYLNSFPYNYSQRKEKINIGTKSINFYKLSLEDIVVSEIDASRERDILDIKNKLVLNMIDWNKLEICYFEVIEFKMSDFRAREFKYLYDVYVKKYKR
ncbi:MAG: DUF6036 family nucleotidyltransferase [Candidatus Izemoplasma sp.]